MTRRRITKIKVRDARTADALVQALTYHKQGIEARMTFRHGLKGDKTDLRRVKSLIHQAHMAAQTLQTKTR